jgi:hypothetical protein
LSSIQEGIFGAPSLCVRRRFSGVDERKLVSSAGLVPVLKPVGQTGLSRMIGEHVDLPSTRVKSGAFQ